MSPKRITHCALTLIRIVSQMKLVVLAWLIVAGAFVTLANVMAAGGR